MAPSRKLTGPSASTEAYPTGAVLLGQLRDAINIPLDAASSRTTSRVAAGETVEEISVLQFCRALAVALVEKKVVPTSGIENADRLVTNAIYNLVRKWDAATMTLRVGTPRPLDWRVMTIAAAQLFVVELGIRIGAWIAMQRQGTFQPPADSRPTYSKTMGVAVRDTGITQGALAKKLRVPKSTIARWRRGDSRPQDIQLDNLGTMMGEDFVGRIRRNLICASLFDRLAHHLPDPVLGDFWRAFVCTTEQSYAFHASKTDDTCRWTVVFGATEHAQPLIDALLENEPEFRWRAPIDSALHWGPRLELARAIAWRALASKLPVEILYLIIAHALNEATTAIGQIAEVVAKVHPELAGLATAGTHLFNAAVAQRQRRFDDAVEHLKRASNVAPTDAGVASAVIDGLIRAGELDEALVRAATQPDGAAEARQIWAAKQLWCGRTFDGLDEMESLLAEGDTHPEMFLYVGVARYQARNFVAALDALERVVADERFQHHGLALDIAAECAFRSNRNKHGEELARRANQVGVSRMYLAWQATRLQQL